MMDDKIKALEERIEKLESVIVYLVSSQTTSNSRNSDTETDELLGTAFPGSPHNVCYVAKRLFEEYDGNSEQVIEKCYAIIKCKLDEENGH